MEAATYCEVGARHDYLHQSGRLLAAEKSVGYMYV